MIQSVEALAPTLNLATACNVLNVPRSSLYRQRQPKGGAPLKSEPTRALSHSERQQVRQTLDSDRFADCAPRQVYAALLDEGQYLCSPRTMYRILAENCEIRERRNQLRHPNYAKPELLATGPNQVWSWDITKMLGPTKWTYFYLYVVLDIFSRYVVGWLLAERESSRLAEELIGESCVKQNIQSHQLTLHADRGSTMLAKPLALLMSDLGVTKSHSRPHVSNDNPFSESQFKTMKYRPDYPARFGCLPDARLWARAFFTWYNHHHYHSALGLLTPAVVHYGRATHVLTARQQVLQQAYQRHPDRFVKGFPTQPALPSAVWINPPKIVCPAAVDDAHITGVDTDDLH
jgi:putative transposase